jgi:hypothetical protein
MLIEFVHRHPLTESCSHALFRTIIGTFEHKTSGEPKRVERGGGTSSGIFDASGCSFRHSRSSSA